MHLGKINIACCYPRIYRPSELVSESLKIEMLK